MNENKRVTSGDYYIATILLIVFILSFILTINDNGWTLCIFRASSGFPCPGCGMTRSFISISGGNLALAYRYHPLGIVIYVLFLYLFVVKIVEIIRGRTGLIKYNKHFVTIFFYVLIIAMLVNGVIRLIHYN